MAQFKERKFFQNSLRYYYAVLFISSIACTKPLKSQDMATLPPQELVQESTNINPEQENIDLLEELLEEEESENYNQYQSSSSNQSTNSEDEQSLRKLRELLQEIWDSFKEDKFGSKNCKLSMKQRLELSKDVMGALSIAIKAKWNANLDTVSKNVYSSDYKKLSGLQKTNANVHLISKGAWGVIKDNKLPIITTIATIVAATIIYKKYYKNK